MIMKAHLASNGLHGGSVAARWILSPAAWALLGLPVLYLTRCVVTSVVPMLLHAVVPEAVRVVIRLI